MKNIIKLIAILAMCFMVVGMLASCNKKEQPVDNNDDNQTSTEPDFAWVTNEDGTKELYVNGEATGIIQNENNENECPDGKHDFVSVCEHIEHEEDETKDDLYVYKCVDCGYVEIETKGHDYKYVRTVDVTCTTDGYDVCVCRCGKEQEPQNVVKALGHTYKAFNKDNLAASTAAGWELVPVDPEKVTHPYCVCEATPVYVNVCERCEVPEFQNGNVPGHVWGEYYTAIQQGNPCELPEELKVAKCTVCNTDEHVKNFPECVECLDQKVIKPAPGHVMGEWKWVDMPTETKDGLIKRVCEGRDGYPCDGHETKVVPAYNLENKGAYEYSKKDPTCVDEGKHVFVYKIDGKVVESAEDSTFEIKIPAGAGHDITGVEYKWVEDNGMPTATDDTGKIEVVCKNCGEVLEFTVTLNNANITKHGNCGNPVDTYTYEFSGMDSNDKAIVGSVKVEFTVEDPNAHPHSVGEYGNAQDPFAGCIPVEDEEGRIAYVLLCHNSEGTGCNQFIVVGYKDKE